MVLLTNWDDSSLVVDKLCNEVCRFLFFTLTLLPRMRSHQWIFSTPLLQKITSGLEEIPEAVVQCFWREKWYQRYGSLREYKFQVFKIPPNHHNHKANVYMSWHAWRICARAWNVNPWITRTDYTGVLMLKLAEGDSCPGWRTRICVPQAESCCSWLIRAGDLIYRMSLDILFVLELEELTEAVYGHVSPLPPSYS